MLISESFALVYLDKWKERKSISFNRSETLCLAGAGIMDLYLRGKLSLEKKRLEVVDANPTGVEFLDEILTIIKDFKKIWKLKRWIIHFANYRNIQCDSLVFKSLENQGIIQCEKNVKAGIFVKWKYNIIKPDVIQALLHQIQNAFIENQEPDVEFLCLLKLLQIERLFNFSISKEYRSLVKNRLEHFLRYGNYDPIQLEMISRIKKTIKDALSIGGIDLAIPY
jgi:hypothetical protein